MQDEQILSNYNLLNQTTIDLDFGLAGGKVHGSLARAGKVKGQTPKVCDFFFDLVFCLEGNSKIFIVFRSLNKKVKRNQRQDALKDVYNTIVVSSMS